MWTAAAVAAVWGSGRGSGHERRLSLPYPAGFGDSLTACVPACHIRNTRSCRTDCSAFTPAALALSRKSCSSGALSCGLVPAAATDLASRRFAVYRRSASLASITAWFRCCSAIILNSSASGSCVTRSKRIFLSTLIEAELEWFNSRRYRVHYSTLRCFCVYCRPPGLTTSFVSPLSARYFRRALFCMNTLLSTGTLASIFSTRNIWRQKPSSLVCCISTPANVLSPFALAPPRRGRPRAYHRTTIIWVAKSTSSRLLESTRSPPSWFVIYIFIYAPAARIPSSNKKFVYVFEGNNITTQSR